MDKLYSEVKLDDDTILSAKQIKELQKKNAQLDEENFTADKLNLVWVSDINVKVNGSFNYICVAMELFHAILFLIA